MHSSGTYWKKWRKSMDMATLPRTVEKWRCNDLVFFEVRNELCTGEIFLQGAHITKYNEMLWLSNLSDKEPGKPIRGGIPFCFPNFGKGPGGNIEPLHGQVRLEDWTLERCHQSNRGETIFVFTKESDEVFNIRYTISFGAELKTKVEVYNPNKTVDLCYELMLHNYFNVMDVTNLAVTGLEQLPYVNRVATAKQEGEDSFGQRVDRLYSMGQRVTIYDSYHKRRIFIDCQGGKSVCVWNPGPDLTFSDISHGAWKNFVCVERGSVRDYAIMLRPRATAYMQQIISCENL